MIENIRDALKEKILVCDGALGTMFYSYGIPVEQCYESLIIDRPELVLSLHQQYVDAGADIIETNTFGANSVALAHYGRPFDVHRLNVAAAQCARQAAGNKVYVAGSVGPLFDNKLSEEHVADVYRRQILALAEGGVDAVILETFSSLEHIRIAVSVCKRETSLPVIAQMSFLNGLQTSSGDTIRVIIDVLKNTGADVIGANCSCGPAHMVAVVNALSGFTDGFISAQPNAGYPQTIDGRSMYVTSAEYFASYALKLAQAGANIVGGCCGTTPEHIRCMAEVVRSKKPVFRTRHTCASIHVSSRKGLFPHHPVCRPKIIVELLPPKDSNAEKLVATASMLQAKGAEVFSFPESPLAKVRMSAIIAAGLVKQKTGAEVIFHCTCRDRNLIGLQADILGAYAMGLRSVLAVTGDAVALGGNTEASSIFDVDSIKLVTLIQNMKQSYNLDFRIGVAFNPNSGNVQAQFMRLKRKVAAGAEFVMTQPLYDADAIKRLSEMSGELNVPIFAGILPLVSKRNAEFLHNEVPGMRIPDAVRNRMDINDKEKAQQEGIRIVLELIQATKQTVNGYYLISPLHKYEISAQIIHCVHEGIYCGNDV
ncbi:MAG TPA: bifunctional homocysteine S-methyltransferase/methylenetetrahydrofolate reductase [Candidatus Omnitrophota bacterium]|nr:bifunctional homocysteine S-methyltransferase/methylenetetrahydrofolate reductase [Candidatus Omnitrophota bacterium]